MYVQALLTLKFHADDMINQGFIHKGNMISECVQCVCVLNSVFVDVGSFFFVCVCVQV